MGVYLLLLISFKFVTKGLMFFILLLLYYFAQSDIVGIVIVN